METEKKFPLATTVVVLIVIAIIGWWIYSNGQARQESDSNNSSNAVTPTTSIDNTGATSTSSGTTTGSQNVKTFEVIGKPFQFDPGTITVKKGDTVRIVFKNEQGFHDFVVDEFNAKTKQISAGQSETIEFIADKTGSFEYYCSVGNHRAMGMKGTLIVE